MMALASASLMFLVLRCSAEGTGVASSQEACASLDCSHEFPMDQDTDDDGDVLMLLHTSSHKLNSSSGDGDVQVASVAMHRQKVSTDGDGKEVGHSHAESASKVRAEKEILAHTQAELGSATKVQAPEEKPTNSADSLSTPRGTPEGLLESMGQRRSGGKSRGTSATLEYELKDATGSVKNKIVLSLLEAFVVTGCLGVDRCYMGSYCTGVAKGLTMGGLGIWTLIDYFLVIINCIQKSDGIDSLGFQANFDSYGVKPAFYIAIVSLVVKAVSCCCCGANHARRNLNPGEAEPDEDK